MYHNLVLSGGGLKGISHLGALTRLEQLGLINLRKLKGIAGSSVGAIIGLFITLGFTIDQIKDLVYKLDLSKLIEPDWALLIEHWGMDDGTIIKNYLEKVLFAVTKIHNITFEQLHKITGINFIVTGTCVDTKECTYFSHEHTPQLPVSLAVRVSYGLPILFTPVTIDGKKYIDGSCVNNLPFDPFANCLDNTIGILLCTKTNTSSACPEEYVMALFNLMVHMYFQKDQQHKSRTVFVYSDANLSPFRFTIEESTKFKLFRDGVIAVNAFIKKNQ